MQSPLRLRSAIFLLVLGWFILCLPWFAEKRTVPWDSKEQFYPTLYYISQSFRSGDLPLWNPYTFGGNPTVSDPQSLFFSPIAVTLMTAVNKPSVYWFDTVEFLHVLLGGLGMLLLTVHLGRTPLAGLFAAAVYMFGGPAASRLQHVPIILAYGYFPLALLTLDLALKSKRIVWGICFGIVAGIMAAHQVQVAYLFSLVLIGYLLHEGLSSGASWKFFVARSRSLIAAVCTGIITVSIPVFATLQFLPFSTRTGFSYDDAVRDSMHPLTFITFLAHDFFGTAHSTTNWAPGDSTQSFLYAGALPAVLFLFYGITTGTIFNRQFRYFCGVGVFGLLFELGKFTPFYWLAYHVIPGLSLFKRPPDGAFLVNMALAVGTGFLIDRLIQEPPKLRRGLVVGASVSVGTLLALGAWYAAASGKANRLVKEYSLAILFMALALWLLHTATRMKPAMRNTLLLVGLLLLVVDLRVHNLGTEFNTYNPETARRYMESFGAGNPFVHFLKEGLTAENSGPYRAEITAAESIWANGSMVAGIQATQGYNPLRYTLYDQAQGTQVFFSAPRPFTPLMSSYNSPFLNLLGVKYIASLQSLRDLDPKVDESRFKLVFDQGFRVWQNFDVLPRVLAATSVRIDSEPERTVGKTEMAAVDYNSVAVLTKLPRGLERLRVDGDDVVPLPGEGKAIARIQEYRNSEVVILADSSREAIVVLNDLYYPYWRVYVDGREEELLRANYVFRGVHVGPGQHEIVFSFEPFSWPAIQQTLTGFAKAH